MCGIVGQAYQNNRCKPETLRAMRDTMIHRGPDDDGEWYSQDFRVGLAHRRLAIIDLSPRAHQPMRDEPEKLVIIFNGEIYNSLDLRHELEKNGHTFISKSDTEVILAAYQEWGIDCISRLNGMFAFCIYDDREKLLFLARDRAGEKPLYYRYSNGQFSFASELKAIMADLGTPRKLNLDAVNYYLAYGYVPCPMSILKGIQKLPPAHAMLYDIDQDSIKIWKYWDLPEPNPNNNASIQDLSDEFELLLRDSVRRQMISDVPIGVLLSGGCDSSLVTALASRLSEQPLRTFTVSFPGHSQHDEAPFARIVAEHFGTEHTEIVTDETSVDIMTNLAAQFDEPFADHAMIPTYLVAKAIKPHATVALSGDGGDELFGGYPQYAALLKLACLKRSIPLFLRSIIAHCAFRVMPVGMRFRNHVTGVGDGFETSVAHVNLYFDAYTRSRLLNSEIVEQIDINQPEKLRASHCSSQHSLLRQAMQSDFMTTLSDGYLVKVDRASMKASLEVRAPFLDYRIIEFAYRSVSDRFKVSGNQLKILPRYAAKRLLPASLDLNRKQGFTMPISNWIKGSSGQFFKSVLHEAAPDLLNKGFVDKLFQTAARMKRNTSRLFNLTMFELWRRQSHIEL